jgi:hypothetical protein
MTLLGKIARRRPADLLLAAEALLLLAFFRLCLALFPVRKIIRRLTCGRSGGSTRADEAQISRRVGWAVNAAARHSIVPFVCFPQTLAGYAMLRWREVPATIVYGVARSPEGKLHAHTWLIVRDKIITGGDESAAFTEVERWT